MTDFTIKSMTIINSNPNMSGSRVLASYNMAIAGMSLKGCVLIENAQGIVSAMGLLGKTNKGDPIMLRYTDPVLQRAITRRASETYTQMTGVEVADE